MNTLQAGFSRVNITPPLGIKMRGYYEVRRADGVLDELEINTIALRCGEDTVLLMDMDMPNFSSIEQANELRANVSERTGVPVEAIYIQANHTHTGPYLLANKNEPLEVQYYEHVRARLADAAQMAIDDLKPAKMGWAVGHAPNIAHIRLYRMKDGSICTNPGANNPDVIGPVSQADDEVIVLRFDQEGGDSLVLIHFADHPDAVGGCKISADWPGATRRTLEKAIDGVKSVVFNGAQGDVCHDVADPKGGELNDVIFFPDGYRSYKHCQYMGRVVAGAVMQVYDKVNYTDVDSLRYANRDIDIPSNKPQPEEMEQARYLIQMHKEGRDSELPYKGMMLTTRLADASRKIRLENAPDFFRLTLSGIAIGNIGMVGIQGEPFNAVGCALKKTEGYDTVLTTCLTNGNKGYYPMKVFYEAGTYETCASNFKAGVAEILIEESQKMLAELKK